MVRAGDHWSFRMSRQIEPLVDVDVGVVDFRSEGNLWWLEWIVGREMNVEEEDASCVGRVLRSHDGCLPVELVSFISGASRTVDGRVTTKVNKFLLDSFKCHIIVYIKRSSWNTTLIN